MIVNSGAKKRGKKKEKSEGRVGCGSLDGLLHSQAEEEKGW